MRRGILSLHINFHSNSSFIWKREALKSHICVGEINSALVRASADSVCAFVVALTVGIT